MPISAQTTTDLNSMLETLDQRIYELPKEDSTSLPELRKLHALREQVASLILPC